MYVLVESLEGNDLPREILALSPQRDGRKQPAMPLTSAARRFPFPILREQPTGAIMMKLELVISCLTPPRAAQAPQIRAWVDPQPEQGLDSELELKLEPLSHGKRRAEIKLGETHEYLFYRVGIVADPSTVWHLLIQDQKSGRVLHEDSDLLALPKGYLIGSCQLRSAATAAVSRSRLQPVAGGQASRSSRFLAAHAAVP